MFSSSPQRLRQAYFHILFLSFHITVIIFNMFNITIKIINKVHKVVGVLIALFNPLVVDFIAHKNLIVYFLFLCIYRFSKI